MNWPSMTTKYVLSIRLCYREITQENREGRKAMKFLELPQLTCHNPIILPMLVADLHLLSQSHFISWGKHLIICARTFCNLHLHASLPSQNLKLKRDKEILNPDILKCQLFDVWNDTCSTVQECSVALCGFQHIGFSSRGAAFRFSCWWGLGLIIIVHLKLVPLP